MVKIAEQTPLKNSVILYANYHSWTIIDAVICNYFHAFTIIVCFKSIFVSMSYNTVNKDIKTRSTGTVHTSAKVRLTSVAIRIRIRIQIRNKDRHQKCNLCSLAHCQPSLKNFMQIRSEVFAQSC